MPEEQKKFSFFDSLKKTILPNDEEIKENSNSLPDEDDLLKPIAVKSVTHTQVELESENFVGMSSAKEIDVKFAENFVHSGGKFIYCENEKEMVNYLSSLKMENEWNYVFPVDAKIHQLFSHTSFQDNGLEIKIDQADAAISLCYSLSASEGVIILSPEEATTRRMVNFPNNHLIIAYKKQLKNTVEEAILGFKDKFDLRLPSVLELYPNKPIAKKHHKYLLSADGPKNVFLFYIDSDIE
jgi:L-lactate dehydrogenase complex protein LldG